MLDHFGSQLQSENRSGDESYDQTRPPGWRSVFGCFTHTTREFRHAGVLNNRLVSGMVDGPIFSERDGRLIGQLSVPAGPAKAVVREQWSDCVVGRNPGRIGEHVNLVAILRIHHLNSKSRPMVVGIGVDEESAWNDAPANVDFRRDIVLVWRFGASSFPKAEGRALDTDASMVPSHHRPLRAAPIIKAALPPHPPSGISHRQSLSKWNVRRESPERWERGWFRRVRWGCTHAFRASQTG
jgi:hypothetical protein